MNKVNLPEGWCLTTLGNVVELKYGKSLPASKRDNGKFLVFGSNGIVGSHSEPLVKTEGIIVGRKGSYGEVHLSNSPFFPIDTTYYVDNLFSQPLKYWFYQLKTLPLTELNRSTAIPGLNREDAYSQFIALPPLAEQKMIADKLDALLAQVQATKSRLERILKILKTFRQSVLAAAVSGKLTEEWRVTNTKVVGKIKPLAFAGKVIAGQSPSKSEVNSEGKGEPYVTGPEQWDGKKILHHKWTEYPKRMAPEGSIFVTVKGAGVGTTFPGCYAAIGRDVYAFVPNENMNYTYILFAIQASAKDVVLKAKGLILGLTKSDIVDHEVYLPSINEQVEIVHRVEQLFAFSDSIEQKTNSALARVNNLTQSILAKAFRGELTTDWRAIHPDLISGENSAEALLKKIKIEREVLKKQPRSRIVKKKKESSTLMANKLISVLEETRDWIVAQEAFRLCGVADGTSTERIEELYSELRDLDKAGRLQIAPVTDEQGRKLYDRLKLVGV